MLIIAAQVGLAGMNYASMRFITLARAQKRPGEVKGAIRVALVGASICSLIVVGIMFVRGRTDRGLVLRQCQRHDGACRSLSSRRCVRSPVRVDAGPAVLNAGVQDDGAVGYRRHDRPARGQVRSGRGAVARGFRGSRRGHIVGGRHRDRGGGRGLVPAADADRSRAASHAGHAGRSDDPVRPPTGGRVPLRGSDAWTRDLHPRCDEQRHPGGSVRGGIIAARAGQCVPRRHREHLGPGRVRSPFARRHPATGRPLQDHQSLDRDVLVADLRRIDHRSRSHSKDLLPQGVPRSGSRGDDPCCRQHLLYGDRPNRLRHLDDRSAGSELHQLDRRGPDVSRV